MPYVTQIPSSLITVGVDGSIAFVPDTSLLNAFESSQEFERYDVEATNGTTLQNGDEIATVTSDGTTLASGTYLGSAEINNALVTVGIPALANVSLQVNPIAGDIFEGDDGEYYFLSDEPVDDAHIAVTASITVAGTPVEVTAPISEINDQLADAVAAVPLAGPAAAATIRGTGNLLQSTANTAIVTLDYDASGELVLSDDEVVPCFLRGTMIETADGPVAVESLKVGDLVRTMDHGLQPLRWIGCARLDASALQRKPKLRPIRVRAGALGQGMPESDLFLSPQHRVLVRSQIAQRMFCADEVLVAATHLTEIDGIEVVEDDTDVVYYHMLFDRHEVVFSNGAATEAMYTGDQAMKAVGEIARAEIFALFPQLQDRRESAASAKPIASGRKARNMVARHVRNGRELVAEPGA